MGRKIICFPKDAEHVQDREGFVSQTPEFGSGIRAIFRDATRSDATLASQEGYTASIICEIDAVNYSGQPFFLDKESGQIYDIRRTYQGENRRLLQMVCEEREHGKIQHA